MRGRPLESPPLLGPRCKAAVSPLVFCRGSLPQAPAGRAAGLGSPSFYPRSRFGVLCPLGYFPFRRRRTLWFPPG